jgi:hypothetical protein
MIPPGGSDVVVFAFAGGVLDSEDDNLPGALIDCVVNEVWVAPSHNLSNPFDGLSAAGAGKGRERLKRSEYGATHPLHSLWIALLDLISNLGAVASCARGEPQFHGSKRRKAASTSSSVANWRRSA